ncbi:hypothetical protein D3C80_969410 [compost metagenome]
MQQTGVDAVALAQHLVQFHRADNGPQIGHAELRDGVGQVIDAIGGLGRVHHLDEDDAVDLHHGVVPGDDLLGRHVQHLLHHVHPAADALDERRQDVNPRRQGLGVFAEAFDREFTTLRHDLDHAEQEDERENREHHKEDQRKIHKALRCGGQLNRGACATPQNPVPPG